MDAAIATLKTLVASASQDAHESVLNTLHNLMVSIEKPIDALNRLSDAHMPLAVVKSATDSGMFKTLAESSEPLSAEQVASKVGAAPLITARILRYLVAHGLVTETGANHFAANEKTKAFAQPSYQGGVNHYFETVAPVNQAVPAFLEETKYQDIVSNSSTPFNKANNTKEPPFIWFEHEPQKLGYFMQYMPIQREGQADWLSVFPVEKESQAWKAKSGGKSAVFVDIGGGFGHQAIGFSMKYPSLGRVIVQDLPSVLEHAQLPPSVEKQPMNFFEGQPEKGAKFYYLRNILHDYPDEQAIAILKHTSAALGPESVILIDEMCLPEKGIPLYATVRDLMMGFSLGSAERTLQQWTKLLDAAGLKITSTHQYTHTLADTVIVAVPK